VSRVFITSSVETPDVIAHIDCNKRERSSSKVILIDELVGTLPSAVHECNYRFTRSNDLFSRCRDAVNQLDVAI